MSRREGEGGIKFLTGRDPVLIITVVRFLYGLSCACALQPCSSIRVQATKTALVRHAPGCERRKAISELRKRT